MRHQKTITVAEKTICNLHDLIDAAEYAEKTFKQETWWRGQSCDFPLLPSVHRFGVGSKKDQSRGEQDLARRFLIGATTRHSHWPDDKVLQLAMMQHYGLPTRLLDWTESPLFALYFAVEKADDKPGVIWALSPSSLNQVEFGLPKPMLLSPYNDKITALFEVPFVDVQASNMVAAVSIRHIDLRQSVQLSVFSIHGDNSPLNERRANDQFLMRFEIPANSKKSLRLELVSIGIRESTIFPDLEHLASELKKMAKDDLI